MSETTSTGNEPRTGTEESLSNSSDDGSCATCDADADGIDARDRLPTCKDCASLQADGGLLDKPGSSFGDEVEVRLADLSAFQRDILWILHHDGALHGLGIKSALQEYYREEVNHGRLYPNLDDLCEMDLLEKGTRDQRTNEYELTDDAEYLLEVRRSFTDSGEVLH
ncbi:helix-turn-helix transcriptional regulator [Haloarcula pellucida]|uniref:Transcription regulator PadR N-terminal domain-containing protein n=1 Tax=Haloarcula pellucida TaxID=1427151 RepID=A0A830GKQ0_9EURY|nr:helix-turn-helix transcriptional regulator [Halomicroarcula pellucida]MBX0348558.1 PadR family transcriptional regulator [Halomicroarcula pellucida]GGN92842.1 hypothetical protein GCM10009030_17510 [Halomicroarcula pellucida]